MTMIIMIIMTTMMIIKSMKGCVLFLGGIIQVGIRTSNYLNDKDTLASLYYDNDSDVYSPKMTSTVVIVMTMIKKS